MRVGKSALLSVAVMASIAATTVPFPAMAKGKPVKIAPAPSPAPAPAPSPTPSPTPTLPPVATTVAVLDGLTDCAHQDLAGRCMNIKLSNGSYTGPNVHGTHVAGTIAGTTVGTTPKAIIRNYAVFDDRGWVAGTVLVGAWQDAYDNGGARISSMSFGCSGTALCFTSAEVGAMADPNRPMLFVKAAGNDGAALPNESIAVSTKDASAAMARTILVGSVGTTGVISSFSNKAGSGCLVAYDSAGACPSNLLWKNHFIVALGEGIYSTLPGNVFGYMSGTSMAAPAVAGAAAALQDRWPALKQDPVTLATILLTTATDRGAPGVDEVYGWGQLNLPAAFAAQGTVTYQSVNGTITPLSGTTITISSGKSLKSIVNAFGSLTVYDKFGRDFALGETGAIRFRQDYRTARLMLGRSLLGIGRQRDWASALFSDEPQARGFAMFGSAGEIPGAALNFDSSMRMGVDLPLKSGVAQIRLTGTTGARTDFAYDSTLRPLSFFASTGMLSSSLVVNTMVPLRNGSRLMVYGTTTTRALNANRPTNPLQLRPTVDGYMPQMALSGERSEQKRTSVGAGYWQRAGQNTVFGVNASAMVQTGGYYDLTSNLKDFRKPTRLFNLGAVVSHRSGDWELLLVSLGKHV